MAILLAPIMLPMGDRHHAAGPEGKRKCKWRRRSRQVLQGFNRTSVASASPARRTINSPALPSRGVSAASMRDESHSGLIMFLPHSVRVMMGGRDGETDGRHQDAGARIIPDA